ncbi:MAG: thiamine pyrophosphate-dependent enzyme, partial [Flavobacteriales bacterium]
LDVAAFVDQANEAEAMRDNDLLISISEMFASQNRTHPLGVWRVHHAMQWARTQAFFDVLAGQGRWDGGLTQRLKRLATLPQACVLTEATSNLDDAAFISCIDRAIEGVSSSNESDLMPDLLITFGGAVVSKRIKGLLRKWRPEQHWHIDAAQRHYDTYQSLTHDIAVSPDAFFAQVAPGAQPCPSTYGEAWRMVDARTRGRHAAILKDAPWCDLKAFEIILQRIPEGSDVHLANSTPARYAQLFDRKAGLRWFSNRGASGIDGCTSTAVGSAFATQRPTTLITGDTAFLYDSNAFWNRHLSPLLRVIVMDNGGGNIFRYIEGPDRHPGLLTWFEAPHGRDPLNLARSLGLPGREANDAAGLEEGLDWLHGAHEQPAVLVVRTDAALSPKVLREYFKRLRD